MLRTFLTTETFIQKSIEINGDKYDYSKTIYVKGSDKVIITCKEHGDFLQQGIAHIKLKQGCPTCGTIRQVKKRTKTLEKFIEDTDIKNNDTLKRLLA